MVPLNFTRKNPASELKKGEKALFPVYSQVEFILCLKTGDKEHLLRGLSAPAMNISLISLTADCGGRTALPAEVWAYKANATHTSPLPPATQPPPQNYGAAVFIMQQGASVAAGEPGRHLPPVSALSFPAARTRLCDRGAISVTISCNHQLQPYLFPESRHADQAGIRACKAAAGALCPACQDKTDTKLTEQAEEKLLRLLEDTMCKERLRAAFVQHKEVKEDIVTGFSHLMGEQEGKARL